MTTALELISDAYQLSGLVGLGFQTISTRQASVGFRALQQCLKFFKTNAELLPYFVEYTFDMVPGQKNYEIANLVEVEFVSFYIDAPGRTLRVPGKYVGRVKMYGGPRIDDVSSIPYAWNNQPTPGGMQIEFYFTPDLNYAPILWGKFIPVIPTLETDLTALDPPLDDNFIAFLTYMLAVRLCIASRVPVSQDLRRELRILQQNLLSFNCNDVRVFIQTPQNGSFTGIGLADAYYLHGFRPLGGM